MALSPRPKSNGAFIYLFGFAGAGKLDRGAFFLPVRLLVDGDELVRRIASPEREEMMKLTNPDAARHRTENEDVFRPEGYDYLELDVTDVEPERAAERILDDLERRLAGTR